MKRKLAYLALAGVAAALCGCAYFGQPGPVGNSSVPEPAKLVDLARYQGKWYEQFRYEAPFQKNMDMVTAEYVSNPDGTIKVINSGRPDAGAGQLKQSVGVAKVVDTQTNAKLKVSFFGPFYGNYWVMDHGDDYEWSIVGEPSGRYLWALTRQAHPGPDMLAMLESRVKALGYDWSLVRMTKQ